MRRHSLSRRYGARKHVRSLMRRHAGRYAIHISSLLPPPLSLSLSLSLSPRIPTRKQISMAVKRRNASATTLPINRRCCREFIILITHFLLACNSLSLRFVNYTIHTRLYRLYRAVCVISDRCNIPLQKSTGQFITER